MNKIHSKSDLLFFIARDRERNIGNPSLLQFIAKSIYGTDDMLAYKYLKGLRKLEYAENCLRNKGIYGKFIWLIRKYQHQANCKKYNIMISPNMVGYGLKMPHVIGGGIIINCTSMGNNCGINVGVVVGKKNNEKPIIGDCVLLLAGCKVIGNVRVGEGAKVAPNSVVIKDIPPYTAVSGIPAVIIKKYK